MGFHGPFIEIRAHRYLPKEEVASPGDIRTYAGLDVVAMTYYSESAGDTFYKNATLTFLAATDLINQTTLLATAVLVLGIT